MFVETLCLNSIESTGGGDILAFYPIPMLLRSIGNFDIDNIINVEFTVERRSAVIDEPLYISSEVFITSIGKIEYGSAFGKRVRA